MEISNRVNFNNNRNAVYGFVKTKNRALSEKVKSASDGVFFIKNTDLVFGIA